MKEGHEQAQSPSFANTRRRGITIVQIIGIVAALLILLIVMLPIALAAKAQASLTSCTSRLHLVALAMQMYRVDNDGPLNWREDETTGPYSHWSALQAYLPAKTVHCPNPGMVPNTGKDLFDYRRWTLASNTDPESAVKESGHSAPPNPETVFAYCSNHSDRPADGRYPGANLLTGKYPFVREDGSTKVISNREIEVWSFDGAWHAPPLMNSGILVLRFPHEPWPPTSE